MISAILVIYATTIVHGTTMDDITINTFQTNPGIFFEKIGTANLIKDDWNIISYFDMTNFKTELDGYKTYLEELQYTCDQISKFDPQCKQLVLTFSEEIKDLSDRQEQIFTTTIRNKRGLIDGVGKLSKFMFGTLDAEDAKYYDEEIKKLSKNDQHILNLIKNQTLIVDSTVKILKNTESQNSFKFDSLSKKLESVANSISRADEHSNGNTLATQLNSIMISVSIMMGKLAKTQEAILDLVEGIKNGRPSPLIISAKSLEEQLNTIRKGLPNHLTLPIADGKNPTARTIKISHVSAQIHESRLIIKISVPIVSREIFTIRRLIPVPTLRDDHYVYIQPSFQYLAVDLPKEHYYVMSGDEFTKCLNIKEDRFICAQNHPVFNAHGENMVCEIELLKHTQTLPEDCQVRATPQNRFYIQL